MKILYFDKQRQVSKTFFLKDDDKRASQILQILEDQVESGHPVDRFIKLVGKAFRAMFRRKPAEERRPT